MLYTDQFYYLGLIALMPLIGALINGLIGAKLPRKLVDVIACSSIGLSFMFSLISIKALVDNAAHIGDETIYGHLSYTAYQWIYAGDFGVDIAFMLDPLTSMMLLLITGIGFLIHLYSVGYMSEEPAKWRYFSYLNLFCFSMLLLVLGKNMLVTFIGWEGVGACSYLLIGFWYTDDAKAAAGQKAFIVNRVGDFAFLVGMFILFYETGTVDYVALKEIATDAASMASIAPIAGVASILIFIGCTGKSAQIPLFVWLPDAMAGPTPVSALIHAATMVTSGVFLLSRMNWLLTISPEAMMVVAIIGALTAFFGATMALVQNDIKGVLAYSTVSQLGYMFLAVGVGSFTGALFHVMTHAFFKALLFLGSGSVIHSVHTQDIREMGGLRKVMPWTAGTFLVGCMAISGFPLMSGFFSKDLILWSAFSNVHVLNIKGVLEQNIGVIDLLTNTPAPAITAGGAVDVNVLALVVGSGVGVLGVITAGLTAFYMFRLYFMTFEGEYRGDEETLSHAHESPPTMVIPLAVLAFLAAFGGLTGWPHFIVHWLHLPEGLLFFEHWYEEIFQTSNQFRIVGRFGAKPYVYEAIATAISVGVGLTGIFFAHRFYLVQPEVPGRVKAKFEKLHQVLTDKYYVDEGYDLAFVKSSIKAGEGLTFFDKNILDGGLVNGAAQIMVSCGRILRNMQSGDVQRYATYITLGVVLSLAVLYGYIS